MSRYRLTWETIAIQQQDGKGVAIILPEGSEVTVADRFVREGAFTPALVEARWGQKTVNVFLRDLLARGERIASA